MPPRRTASSIRYEPDESRKRKHYWDRPHAGFEDGPDGESVGKCPVDMTIVDAQALLDDGIPFHSHPRRARPTYVYAVSDAGVLYRGTWTTPGQSMHGFPEDPARFPKGRTGVRLRDAILEQARRKGCETQLRDWMQWPQS